MPPRDLAHVLDALPDGVVVLDAAGRVEQLNAEASRILGLSLDALAGRPVEQLLGHAATPWRGSRARCSRQGAPASRASAWCPSASARPWWSRWPPRRSSTGGTTADGAVLVLRDRTLQRSSRSSSRSASGSRRSARSPPASRTR